jgi:hypothetical protein
LRLETILAAVSDAPFSIAPGDADIAVELRDTVNHFDGIVAAGDLRHIMRADGFAETRYWLKRLMDTVSAEKAAIGATVLKPDDSQTESSVGQQTDNLPPPAALPRETPLPVPPAPEVHGPANSDRLPL